MIKIELPDLGSTEIIVNSDGSGEKVFVDAHNELIYSVDDHKELIIKMVKRIKELEDGMRVFVRRVENGAVRSQRPYADFKKLLGETE